MLKLEHAFDLRISFGQEMRLGPTSFAHSRAFFPVIGGAVFGPRLTGEIVPGSGSDAPRIMEDRAVIEGEWLICASDGTLILMRNNGFARAANPGVPWRGDTPEFSHVSLHLVSIFEAPDGPHAWLNRTVFVGKGDRRRIDANFCIYAVM